MCTICDGMSFDEHRQLVEQIIDEHGWFVQGVEPGPENRGWAYTVGLIENFDHPELVVVDVGWERAGAILNVLAEEIRDGLYLHAGERVLVDEIELEFAAVHPAQLQHDVFNTWLDHYRALPPESMPFSALQVMLPKNMFCAHPFF